MTEWALSGELHDKPLSELIEAVTSNPYWDSETMSFDDVYTHIECCNDYCGGVDYEGGLYFERYETPAQIASRRERHAADEAEYRQKLAEWQAWQDKYGSTRRQRQIAKARKAVEDARARLRELEEEDDDDE